GDAAPGDGEEIAHARRLHLVGDAEALERAHRGGEVVEDLRVEAEAAEEARPAVDVEHRDLASVAGAARAAGALEIVGEALAGRGVRADGVRDRVAGAETTDAHLGNTAPARRRHHLRDAVGERAVAATPEDGVVAAGDEVPGDGWALVDGARDEKVALGDNRTHPAERLVVNPSRVGVEDD